MTKHLLLLLTAAIEAYADGSNAGPTHIAAFNYKISGDGATLSGKPKLRPSRLK